jgi:hypothetical protein
MKRIATALLCAALVMLPVQTSRPQIGPAFFVLTCAAIGGLFVVWVYYRSGYDSIPHRMVLQKDHYDSNRTNMATNYAAIMPGTNSLSLFVDYMNDNTARYRVADLGRLDKP